MRYLRVDDKTLRTAWGINVDLVKEDDKFFYYKVYRQMGGVGPVAGQQAVITPEEVQKIAATYQVDTLESQLLKFVPFSTGLPDRGQWRNGFDIADMNGDGHLDIVHSAGAQGARPAGHLPRRRQGELAALERGPVPAACPTTTATPRWGTSTATATRTSRSASTCAG